MRLRYHGLHFLNKGSQISQTIARRFEENYSEVNVPRYCWCGILWSIVISASNSRWAASMSLPFSMPPQPCSRTVTTACSSPKKRLSLRSRCSPLSGRRSLDTNFTRRVMSETIAAWMVHHRLVRPGIAAHAHAWRVHNGKQHLRLVTVVVLGVKLAIERVLPFVHAEGADPTCVFTANLTLPDRCLILAQGAHTLAADAPLARIYHTQLQLRGSAEVVGVLKTATFAQDLAELDLHGAFVGTREHAKRPIPVRIGNRIGGPIDLEITEMTAAFQPLSSQKVVQLFEGGVGSHLHVHPEDGRVGVFDPHTKEPCDLSLGRLVLGQAAFQMARYRCFGSALATHGAATV